MPISNGMVESEVRTQDARPKPRRNGHVKEKTRMAFCGIEIQLGLHPTGQEFTSQRIDAAGRNGGRRAGIQDNGSAEPAGLQNGGVIFVKEFRWRDAMGNFPDMEIG